MCKINESHLDRQSMLMLISGCFEPPFSQIAMRNISRCPACRAELETMKDEYKETLTIGNLWQDTPDRAHAALVKDNMHEGVFYVIPEMEPQFTVQDGIIVRVGTNIAKPRGSMTLSTEFLPKGAGIVEPFILIGPDHIRLHETGFEVVAGLGVRPTVAIKQHQHEPHSMLAPA